METQAVGKAHLQAPGGGGSGVAEGFLRQKVAGSGQQLGKLPQERGHGKASLCGGTVGGPGSAWGRFLRRRCAAVESGLAATAVGGTGPRVEPDSANGPTWACSSLSGSATLRTELGLSASVSNVSVGNECYTVAAWKHTGAL